MKSYRKANIKNSWLKSVDSALFSHPKFLTPFGSTLPDKKTPILLKLTL
jgi:hypothetical protein